MKSKSKVVVYCFPVGIMAENCYLVCDENSRQTIIIDPGDEADFISTKVNDYQLKPVAIILTHGHFDHCMAAGELGIINQLPCVIAPEDRFLLDRMEETAAYFLGYKPVIIKPIQVQSALETALLLGSMTISVLPTPGHTPGSVSYFLSNELMLFCGDVMFAGGSIGRTDFSYADTQLLQKSVSSLLTLPEQTRVYPGHGAAFILGETRAYRK